MAVSMDPERARASAAIAWQDPDGRPHLRLLYDVTGSPIDTDAFGQDLRQTAAEYGVRRVAFDPLTDAELAKYLRAKPEPITGRLFANASSTFVAEVSAKRLVWSDADAVTADLLWAAKKEHDETGSFQAVRAKDDRPITAALAAIRAVWLATGMRAVKPKVL
jgi:hypothetical protein